MKTEAIFIVPIYYTFNRRVKGDKTILVGLNWYRNAHYRISNNVKKHYKKIIRSQLSSLSGVRFSKVTVEYNLYLKRRGSDGGNVTSIIEKFVLDALTDKVKKKGKGENFTGLIEDDNCEIVVGKTEKYFLDKDNPRCEIIIKQVNY